MPDSVFINDRSAFDTSSSGKSLMAFPDLCLCPPPPPTGPIPTPLPNNALVSDITGCATSVTVNGNPAAHKNSYISTSNGDEPGDPKSGGQGNVVTHVVKGKAYFQSHSMDVLIEGVEAVRHLDITTHNHACPPAGTPPNPVIAKMAVADFMETGKAKCGEECDIVRYDKKCPKPKTPHHILPKHCFKEFWNDVAGKPIPIAGWAKYNQAKAPCVCVSGSDKAAAGDDGALLDHGLIHDSFDVAEAVAGKRNGEANKWTYSEAKAAGVKSVREGTNGRCDDECVAAVLDAYHKDQCKGSDDQELRAFCPKGEQSKLWQKAFGDGVTGDWT